MIFLAAPSPSLFWIMLVIYVGLTACSEPIGPSDERVKRDIQEDYFVDLHNYREAGVSWVDAFVLDKIIINKREVLSDNRVKFHVTVSVKANEEGIRRSVDSEGMPKTILENTLDFEEGIQKLVEDYNTLSDKELTQMYHLKKKGIWDLEKEYRGHR